MRPESLALAFALVFAGAGLSFAATPAEEARRCVQLVNARSDLEQAVGHCTRAIGSRAFKGINLAPLYYNRGWAQDELGNRQAAVEDYSSAIKIQPDFLQAYVARGYAQMVEGALSEAIEDFSLVLRVDPDVFVARFNRALAYERLGERDLAAADFRKAAVLQPDNPRLKQILEQLEWQAQ